MSKTGTTIRYEYNHEGLRTQKFVDTNNKTDATYYTYNGKSIIHVIKNSDHLHIFYDAQNRPAKVSHNGIFYTYLYNLQGDVIGLLDKNGVLVVEYKYDAWGKPLSITGTLANTLGKFNPFRYRGYVYDDQTGLYYLHSRYYNPVWIRFINVDVIIEGNAFKYCGNMPIAYLDHSGTAYQCAYDMGYGGNMMVHYGGGGGGVITVWKHQAATHNTIITNGHVLNSEKLAKQKYNKNTVNVYMSNKSKDVLGKINMRVYSPGPGRLNVHISDSRSITSLDAMNAILDVFMDSEYYSEEVFGTRDFMRAQWLAHNWAYELASSGRLGFIAAQMLSGSENPIESADELDIRSLNNIGRKGTLTYKAIQVLDY